MLNCINTYFLDPRLLFVDIYFLSKLYTVLSKVN